MSLPTVRSTARAYRTAREGGAAVDLSSWIVLRLRGSETRAFLQGLGTQDFEQTTQGGASPTFFLNEKGRVIALAWVQLRPDGAEAWVVADGGARGVLRPHMERFRIMEDVEFEGPDGMPRLIGLVGPERASLLRRFADSFPGAVALPADPISFLLVPTEHAGNTPVDFIEPAAFEAWRLAVGLPLAGIDYDAERIATELSYPAAISMTKGCYVGQEVVSRTTHRGKVRRRRVGFRFDWDGVTIPAGTEIHSGGVAAGFVTSAVREPDSEEGLGMGYLATEALDRPGEAMAIDGPRTRRLRVRSWPL
jgi:folate-binding protein YgfZ